MLVISLSLHDAGKGYVSHLQGEMDMVRHQAKRMNTKLVALNSFLENEIKATPVFIGKKYLLTCVASKYHVIERARVM